MTLLSRMPANVTLVSRSAGTSRAHTPQDGRRPVLGGHPDDDPTSILERLHSLDVPGELAVISAMLVAIVFDRNLYIVPTHIESGE